MSKMYSSNQRSQSTGSNHTEEIPSKTVQDQYVSSRQDTPQQTPQPEGNEPCPHCNKTTRAGASYGQRYDTC